MGVWHKCWWFLYVSVKPILVWPKKIINKTIYILLERPKKKKVCVETARPMQWRDQGKKVYRVHGPVVPCPNLYGETHGRPSLIGWCTVDPATWPGWRSVAPCGSLGSKFGPRIKIVFYVCSSSNSFLYIVCTLKSYSYFFIFSYWEIRNRWWLHLDS